MASTVRIALAHGDGIGPEVTKAALRVIEAAGADAHLEFIEVEMGERVFAAGDARGQSARTERPVPTARR